MLPDRSIEAEDAFLQEMATASPDSVQDAISAALEHRRPQLAARLVGLLEDDPLDGLDPEERKRARTVTHLLLHERREDPNAWFYEAQELAELWARARRQRLDKVKLRMRGRNRHPRPRMPRKR